MVAEPRLGIVIVTWNCRALALECVRQAAASRVPGGLEIIVVDNASSDDTPAALAAAFPSVKLLVNTGNVGFAAACNQGIAATSAAFVLLLNPDAFPATPDTFAALLAALMADPGLAAAGPRLAYPDGRHQAGDAGYRPTLRHLAAWTFGLHAVVPGLVVVGRPRRPALEVDWLCGAAMMLRRSVLAEIGPFEERFFMYAEDVEWGCRARRHGWRLAYLGGACVTHHQGGTQGSAVRADWLHSLGILYRAHSGAGLWWAFCGLLWLGFTLRGLAYRPFALEKARAMQSYALSARRMLRGPAGGLAPAVS